jgi:hypothetical protein
MSETSNVLHGKTFKWTFEEGPTAGSSYEHTFNADGSVEFRKLSGDESGKPKREDRYASFEVARGVHLVSYLSDSGFTLTVAMNLGTGRIYGFASNDKQWFPVSGTVEAVGS